MNAAPINPGPVFSANNQRVGEASFPLPSMRNTLLGWFRPMTITVVATLVVDGRVREVLREMKTSGIIQAGDPEKLEVKAEGDRSWQNAVLHTVPNFVLETNAVIIIKGTTYRVMAKSDQAGYGYMRYELVQDFSRVK